MRKSTIALTSAIGGLLFGVLAASSVSSAAGGSSYGEDRALIENLQARYLFALDFHDADLYVTTFTPDGVLDYGTGDVRGREAIKKVIAGMPGNAAAQETTGLRPAAGRHHISNIVLQIDGDRAIGRAYWFHTGNDNPERRSVLGGFGHYEDELVRVNGEWLFSKRTIYNEGVAEWAAKDGNPAW
jgi:hypothetical protein